MLDLNTIPRLADGIALYNSDGTENKFYVFNTLTGDYFSTNLFGYTALTMVDGKRSLESIARTYLEQINKNAGNVKNDLLEFFKECIKNDVLIVSKDA